jgi:hypothetical protein
MKGRRATIITLALAATLTAAYFAPEANSGVEPTQRGKEASRDGAGVRPREESLPRDAGQKTGIALRDRSAEQDPDELAAFGPMEPPAPAQKPAPALEPAPVAPPAPKAPALPFRVLGRYVEDGRVQIFLQYNDRNLVVAVGDTVDNLYRIEALNGGTLTLRYLPLDAQQTLDIGAIE